MKESFGELYTRLYHENFGELEQMRKKVRGKSAIPYIFLIAFFISVMLPYAFLKIVTFVGFLVSTMLCMPRASNGSVDYAKTFKEKIVGPIIINKFENAQYMPERGLSSSEYSEANYGDRPDRYESEDMVVVPVTTKKDNETMLVFSEVLTQREQKDEDGHTTYVTIFHGLACSFKISSHIPNRIYIKSNGKITDINANKITMDLPAFEKIFDVESADEIGTMRILTSDVMMDLVDIYEKYKYKFEIHIIDNAVYLRINTGAIFEPGVFKSSMEYKSLEKYYNMLTAVYSLVQKVLDTVEDIEL